MSRRWLSFGIVAGLVFWALLALLIGRATVKAECEPYPVTDHSPTGLAGCEIYGEGTASMWPGPGVARNDCIWPWTECQTIRITSQETGKSIDVTPTMFCDCHIGTSNQRIVDLDPAAVAALGLEPSRGLWPVRVEPLFDAFMLPDTAMEAP